jgi:4-aminobutyrate aminotransferase/(S)-3-amino-2-methylpropionate transaminase
VHTGGLGGTYGGNPLACAAALGAIRTIEEQDLCGAARRIEAMMLPRLRALQDRCPAVGDVRGRGAMIAVELVQPGTTTPHPAATAAVAAACHRAGVVVLTCGTYGNVLRFLPPLVIPDHLLDAGLTAVEEAITDLG